MRKLARVVLVVPLVLLLTAAGCNDNVRWCEYDPTDEQVADYFCEQGIPGYEWEWAGESDHRSRYRTPSTSTTPKPGILRSRPGTYPSSKSKPGGTSWNKTKSSGSTSGRNSWGSSRSRR
ncbi:MAG TPA: hypothetical protein VIL71_23430 [Spirillospora sp.]